MRTILSTVLAGAASEEVTQGDRDALTAISGRYEFSVRVDTGETWLLVLRIDDEMISGDVFGGLPGEHRRRRLVLGGRTDWRYSFVGRPKWAVIEPGKRWLLALCDVTEATGTTLHKAMARGVLALRVEGGTLAIARFSLLSDAQASEAWLASPEWRGSPVTAPSEDGGEPQAVRHDAFRRIRLGYLVATPEATVRQEVTRHIFSDESHWSLRKALAAEGIEVELEEHEFVRVVANAGKDPTLRNPILRADAATALLEDVLVEVAGKPPNGGLEKRIDWDVVA